MQWAQRLQIDVHRTMREQVYRAYVSRASSGPVDNVPIIETILALRQEQAHLTGYSNAAEYLMANKVGFHAF